MCKQLLYGHSKIHKTGHTIKLHVGAELLKTTTKTLLDSATNPNDLFYAELKHYKELLIKAQINCPKLIISAEEAKNKALVNILHDENKFKEFKK